MTQNEMQMRLRAPSLPVRGVSRDMAQSHLPCQTLPCALTFLSDPQRFPCFVVIFGSEAENVISI
jgi:hypothetical protein